MTYPMRWEGKAALDDKSGVARFMVEGQEFVISLPSFADANRLNDLLGLVFRQGKSFAFNAMKSHIANAVNQADLEHSLTLQALQARGLTGPETGRIPS